jgi:hypothetical protein
MNKHITKMIDDVMEELDEYNELSVDIALTTIAKKFEDYIEHLHKTIAWYQGEYPEENHPLEKEHRELCEIDRDKRTPEQTERLILVARAVSNSSYAEEIGSKIYLDNVNLDYLKDPNTHLTEQTREDVIEILKESLCVDFQNATMTPFENFWENKDD